MNWIEVKAKTKFMVQIGNCNGEQKVGYSSYPFLTQDKDYIKSAEVVVSLISMLSSAFPSQMGGLVRSVPLSPFWHDKACTWTYLNTFWMGTEFQ